jgi:hypothetical protein
VDGDMSRVMGQLASTGGVCARGVGEGRCGGESYRYTRNRFSCSSRFATQCPSVDLSSYHKACVPLKPPWSSRGAPEPGSSAKSDWG